MYIQNYRDNTLIEANKNKKSFSVKNGSLESHKPLDLINEFLFLLVVFLLVIKSKIRILTSVIISFPNNTSPKISEVLT